MERLKRLGAFLRLVEDDGGLNLLTVVLYACLTLLCVSSASVAVVLPPLLLYAWQLHLDDRDAARQHELTKIAASKPAPQLPIDDAAFKTLQTQVNTLALRVGLAPPKTNGQT